MMRAVERYKIYQLGICGGVAVNQCLRRLFLSNKKISCYFPEPSLCTDNGAMIAGLAFEYLKRKKINQFQQLTSNPTSYRSR